MKSMKLVRHVLFHKKTQFSDISRKCILPNMITVESALVIFGKMHFLAISENEFFHEIKRDGITSLHGIHEQAAYKVLNLKSGF